jgi:L-amino acid N-acyltransferase YncA
VPASHNIRVASLKDAEAIAALYAPYVATTAISFELAPPDMEEIAARLKTLLPDYPWLVCERDGEIAGYAYASPHRARQAYRWSVDVAVYAAQGAQRKGTGRALYAPLLEILRKQGFYRAYAGIALPNVASVGLHEAFGFKPLGVYRKVGYKLGAWHDVGWWELELSAPVMNPPPPQIFSAGMLVEACHG